jgi:pyroglutamyl-peptidase
MGRVVLVTGFEPFGGEAVNSSWEAARAVDGWRFGAAVAVAVQLPCAYGACVAELMEAFGRLAPESVLMTGPAAGRAIVSVERVAKARSRSAAPDNCGVVLRAAAKQGPEALAATADAHAIARAIRAAGVAARVSTDAGGYVCNHLYYGALAALNELAPATPAVFLHLPATPGQSPPRANRRRLATDDAVLALKAAIQVMASRD